MGRKEGEKERKVRLEIKISYIVEEFRDPDTQ